MPSPEPITRYTVQLPEEVTKAIDEFAQRAHLSRNKAAATLINLGLKVEADKFKRLRELTSKIRAAATDEEAAQYDDELLALVFGPQLVRTQGQEEARLAGMHADPGFQESMKRAMEQADRGEFLSEEEMDARFAKILASLPK
jgi:predicted transcriptional regulator